MVHRSKGTTGAALACVLAGASVTASAALDEIIVTAQRSAVPAQRVPASIAALSRDDLAARGIDSAQDLATVVPNLTWQAGNGSSVPAVFIRGIGSANTFSNQLGAVTLERDGVTLNAPHLAGFDLFDLERVEVLRGPQNALQGRNSSGGTVRFVSARPDARAGWSGFAQLTGGNVGHFEGEGAINVPLAQGLAARIAATQLSRGDHLDNLNLGRGEGGFRRRAARVQLLFARGESFEALVRAHAADFAGDSLRFKQVGLGTPGRPGLSDCAALAYDVNPGNGCVDQTGFADTRSLTQVFSGSPNLFTRSARGGALQIYARLAGATVTSLTAYERGDSRRAEDTDGGPSYLFASTLQAESEQWSQDLRIASQRTAGVNWLGGVYLFRERAGYIHARRTGNPILSSAFTPGVQIPEAGARTNMLFGRLEQRDELASAYGQVEVVLRPRVTLTAELRGTTERKSGTQSGGSLADVRAALPAAAFVDDALLDSLLATATRVPPGFLPLTCPAPFPLTRCWSTSPFDARWNTWSGRVALDARVAQDVLAYASIARGAKGGGVGPVAREILFGAAGRLVDPEFVTTVEIGVKSELLERTLRLNAIVFLNAWRDYQLFLDVPTPVGRSTLLTNLPRSRTLGGEFETEWAPAPGWLLAAGVGLQHARVRSIGDIGDASVGSRLPGTPDVTFNGRAAREFAIYGGRLTVQAAAAYSGERNFDLLETRTLTEPGYWLFDASARFAFGREQRHEAVLWGRNLTATQYCIARQSLAGLGQGDVVGCVPNEARRFVGLSLRTRF